MLRNSSVQSRKLRYNRPTSGRIVQLVRTLLLHRRGRRFESCSAHSKTHTRGGFCLYWARCGGLGRRGLDSLVKWCLWVLTCDGGWKLNRGDKIVHQVGSFFLHARNQMPVDIKRYGSLGMAKSP